MTYRSDIQLRQIGKSADDLRFFILADGCHAGGITIHSVQGDSFSYGIAIAPHMRRKGIAKSALTQLYQDMKARGFTCVSVQIAPDNAASLALHASLGFTRVLSDTDNITLKKAL